MEEGITTPTPASREAERAVFRIPVGEQGTLHTLAELLDRVKRMEVNIYDLNLKEIITRFIAYIKDVIARQSHVNLDESSDILVSVADLHLIKSRMLLPYETGQDKEKDFFGDAALTEYDAERLIEYHEYKQVAETLETLQEIEDHVIAREETPRFVLTKESATEEEESVWENVTLLDLIKEYAKIVYSVEREQLAALIQSDFHLPDAIEIVKAKMKERDSMTFVEFFTGLTLTRRKLILFFLAVLELMKHRFILLKQHAQYDTIHVVRGEAFDDEDFTLSPTTPTLSRAIEGNVVADDEDDAQSDGDAPPSEEGE